jgi:hypothetical protein
MNAQDIWNEYRNSKFTVTDKVKDMILKIKEDEGIRHEIWLKSTGMVGLSELMVHAYYDQREDLCAFLLENHINYKLTKIYVNPEFIKLNNMLE